MGVLGKNQNRIIQKWADNPLLFARHCIFKHKNRNYELEDYQKEILWSVRLGNDVAVKGCHGSGKTFVDALILCWWMLCKPYPRVICTAPKVNQVKTRLWPEIKKLYRDTPLEEKFEWQKTRYQDRDYPDQCYASIEASSDPDNISGIHEDNVLIIIDEAQGVPEEIMEALEGSRTKDSSQLILSGNPVHRDGFFYDAFHNSRDLYDNYTISYNDTKLVDLSYYLRLKEKYGEDSQVVKVRALGEFPDESDEYYITLSQAEKAAQREVERDETAPLDLGVDIGGRTATGDESSITARQGPKVLQQKNLRGVPTTKVRARTIRIAKRWTNKYDIDEVRIKVDDTGIGEGVTNNFAEDVQGFDGWDVYGVKAGSNPSKEGKDEYRYKGDEMWGILQNRIEEIDIPEDDELTAQLSTRPYSLTDSGKIKLMPKQKMEKEEGMSSPDRADSLALAFYNRELYSGGATVSADIVA